MKQFTLLTLFVLLYVVDAVYYPFDIGIRDICMNTSPTKILAINFNLPIYNVAKISIKQISWLLVSDTTDTNPVYINGIQSQSVNPCCGSLCDFGLNNAPWHQAPCGVKPVCSPIHRMMYADFVGTDIDINGTDASSTIELRFTYPLPIGITIYKRVPALSITYEAMYVNNYTFTSTATFSNTPSYTNSPSDSFTPNETMSYTSSESESQTPTYSVSQSQTSTYSASSTQSQTQSQTPTYSASSSQSQTQSQIPTYSASSSQSQSQTQSQTPTYSASSTQSQTQTPTSTQSLLRGIIQQQPLVESSMLTMILLGVSVAGVTSCLLCGVYYICKKCNRQPVQPIYQTYTTGSIPNNVAIPVDSIAVQPRHIRIIPMMSQDEDPPILQVRQPNNI